jgi:DNA helicase-2/ATP-dependent DNA helicase PcrA
MAHTPSIYQLDILDFIVNRQGNAVVDAVAGSGKTTSLEMICKKIIELDTEGIFSIIFVAFSKAIAEELRHRLPSDVEVKTVHALGMGFLRRFLKPTSNNWLNDYKYRDIIGELLDKYGFQNDERNDMGTALDDAVKYCQLTLVDPMDAANFSAMCANYEIAELANLAKYTAEVLQRGIDIAQRVISFSDMIWLPVKLDIPMQKYHWVLVDEAQDLSNCQRAVIAKLMGPHSRLIAVGDPHQAIFGFAGAEVNSFYQIAEDFKAVNLPLSVCYRCPVSHVQMAKEIVPQIQPSDFAQEGTISYLQFDEIFTAVDASRRDMVICRTNAPLINIAFTLIQMGIPAKIKGRDIMTQLVNMAKQVQKLPGANWAEFELYLDEYVSRQVTALSAKKGTEMQIAALEDRSSCLKIIYRRAIAMDQRISTLDGLRKFIDRIYSEDVNGCVVLSSIHKAKGLEADNVFIVKPELLPHPMAKMDWAVAQEYNLKYVALTRAKKSLTFVAGDK